MNKTAKPLAAAIVLLALAATAACGGQPAHPPAANGGNTTSPASAAGFGAASAGTGPAGGGTGPAGSNPDRASATSGGSRPGTSGSMQPTASNQVILGYQFAGASAISFGTILPGQSATQYVKVSNGTGQTVTIASVTVASETSTGRSPFTAGTECTGKMLDPGRACTFSVTFSPSQNGTYNDWYIKIDVLPSTIPGGNPGLSGTAGPLPRPSETVVGPPPTQLAPDGSAPPSSEPVPAGSSSP